VSASDPLGMIGQVLHGQFRVDDLVEDGKRHILYRGAHLMLEVPIAIKCMKAPPGGSHEQFIRRFRHESRLHYKLSQASPHVVRVLASGTAVAPSGSQLTPFMVLEWLDGESLAQDIATRRAQGYHGRTLSEAIRLLDPAVEALAFAHTHSIVHREVTPETLFVAHLGDGLRIKLLDFGVAKILGERALDLPPPSQSMGLAPIGSPAYAAPEQYSSGVGVVGPWTDVYAIAMVLLEMLMDRPVMEEGPVPMGVRVLDMSHRPTPRALGIEVSDRVEAVLAQAVAARPADRQQEAGEFWGMLKNALMRDQDSLQRVSKLPVTEIPISVSLGTETPASGAEVHVAAALLNQERDRVTVPEELRETVSIRDSLTNPRLADPAAQAAFGASEAEAPDSSPEPATMVVAEHELTYELTYDDHSAKTVERAALPGDLLETVRSREGARNAFIGSRQPAQPPAQQPQPLPQLGDILPESADERTVVMQAEELQSLSFSMDPAPVSRQGELFVGAEPRTLHVKEPRAPHVKEARDPDSTAKNPDTTTVSPVKPRAAKPPVVPNMGATWPVTTPQPPGAGGAAFQQAPPFPFPGGQIPAHAGQMPPPGQQGVPMPPGRPAPQAAKKESFSVAVVAILLVLSLVIAIGAALYVASLLGWI